VVRLAKHFAKCITLILLVILAFPADTNAQSSMKQDRYALNLVLADAAIDNDGNIYVIVNTWTSDVKNLVRILPDHTIDRDFRLARIDQCCTVDPFAVDTDAEGNIYIITYIEGISDFVLAKYGPDGELDRDYAIDGFFHFPFLNPVDLEVSPDGVAYILDLEEPEVYAVSTDGKETVGFVYQQYDMIRPAKLQLGPNYEIYLFDLFDTIFSPYDIDRGIVALEADGSPIYAFGADYEGINSGEAELNYSTFVTDIDGSLWVLGPYEGAGPNSGAYHYDINGNLMDLVLLEYRLGDYDTAVRILSDNQSGFIIFSIENVSVVVMRYDIDGKVREKFSAEVFKRPF
jgi:hypothetical protein